jgi:hypothetical protein
MNKAERVYYNTEMLGRAKIAEKTTMVLRDSAPMIGQIRFPYNLQSINQLYFLLENGYYPWLEKSLKHYGYDFGPELQHLISVVTYGERSMGFDYIKMALSKFPSFKGIHRGMYEYELETALGTIKVTPLTRYMKDGKIMKFALTKETHGFCHMAAEEFIRENPQYTAITSLVDNQFGEKQYHSYIETPDGYADFANNAHFSKSDFEKIMHPQELNRVTGEDLLNQASELSFNDLGENKALLLRLGVHRQITK